MANITIRQWSHLQGFDRSAANPVSDASTSCKRHAALGSRSEVIQKETLLFLYGEVTAPAGGGSRRGCALCKACKPGRSAARDSGFWDTRAASAEPLSVIDADDGCGGQAGCLAFGGRRDSAQSSDSQSPALRHLGIKLPKRNEMCMPRKHPVTGKPLSKDSDGRYEGGRGCQRATSNFLLRRTDRHHRGGSWRTEYSFLHVEA